MCLMKEAVKARDDADGNSSFWRTSPPHRAAQPEKSCACSRSWASSSCPWAAASRTRTRASTSSPRRGGSGPKKNPTQLIIDAFIKGISRVCVVHGGSSSIAAMEEALERPAPSWAFRVDLASSWALSARRLPFHFVALLPTCGAPSACAASSTASDAS